jgi:hypothetical protein
MADHTAPDVCGNAGAFERAPSVLRIVTRDAAKHGRRSTRMFTVDVRLSIDEATALMRAIAKKQWTESDAEKRDDLELIRLKLYDKIYNRRAETIRIDIGSLTDQIKREPQQLRTLDALRVKDPEQDRVIHREIHSPRTEHEWAA